MRYQAAPITDNGGYYSNIIRECKCFFGNFFNDRFDREEIAKIKLHRAFWRIPPVEWSCIITPMMMKTAMSRIYGILDRHIGKTILLTVILIALCLTLFTGLITLIDKMRYIGRGDIDFLFVCKYVGYQLPGFFVTFFPVAILIGGVIGLGNLARNSEIVILQSLGLSRLQIAFSCLKSLIPAMAVVLAIGEFVVSPLETYAETQYSIYSTSGKMSVSRSGIWLREGNSFIGISAMLYDGTITRIHRFDTEGDKLLSKSVADRGNYEDGRWKMQNVVTYRYGDDRMEISRAPVEYWDLNLNPERVDVINNIDRSQTIKGLIDYIGYLEANSQDTSSFRLELYSKLMQPVIMVVMLFLALSTVFGPLRSMNMGMRIMIGISLGFGYYVLNQVVAPFSLVYGIPPAIGASMASVVFGAVAFHLLRRKI